MCTVYVFLLDPSRSWPNILRFVSAPQLLHRLVRAPGMDSTGDYVQTFQILGLSDERATPMFDHQPLMNMPFLGGNIQHTHTHSYHIIVRWVFIPMISPWYSSWCFILFHCSCIMNFHVDHVVSPMVFTMSPSMTSLAASKALARRRNARCWARSGNLWRTSNT